jgi:hypothetical protein
LGSKVQSHEWLNYVLLRTTFLPGKEKQSPILSIIPDSCHTPVKKIEPYKPKVSFSVHRSNDRLWRNRRRLTGSDCPTRPQNTSKQHFSKTWLQIKHINTKRQSNGQATKAREQAITKPMKEIT